MSPEESAVEHGMEIQTVMCLTWTSVCLSDSISVSTTSNFTISNTRRNYSASFTSLAKCSTQWMINQSIYLKQRDPMATETALAIECTND